MTVDQFDAAVQWIDAYQAQQQAAAADAEKGV